VIAQVVQVVEVFEQVFAQVELLQVLAQVAEQLG
jgi:hypothetical protein